MSMSKTEVRKMNYCFFLKVLIFLKERKCLNGHGKRFMLITKRKNNII